MKDMNIYDVVKKLTGEIKPVGETNEDNKRYENLKVVTELIEELLKDIHDVEELRNDYRASLKKAGSQRAFCHD